ncbi:MAG: hypothetical protein GX600_10895 [Dehalococcoidia bacterium]|nr:hypothetical protein [Dehalococcoidia bacterium]
MALPEDTCSRKGIPVLDLCEAVDMNCRVLGRHDRVAHRPASLDNACAGTIAFCGWSGEDAREHISRSAASVIICTPEAGSLDCSSGKTLLLVARPRLAFIRIMRRFFAPWQPVGIHPSAAVHRDARIGQDVHIGPFTYVGRAEIGDGTIIDGHVHIHDGVRIGRNCTVQANAVIGACGFGLERNEDSEFEEFPHIGGVHIGDDVLVSSGVVIARGTMDDTEIGSGTKIDALAEISHNVVIGPDCGVCASVVIAGSVRIGARTWVSCGACLRNGVRVGSDACIGMGAVVTGDVLEGVTVYGVPAREVGPDR